MASSDDDIDLFITQNMYSNVSLPTFDLDNLLPELELSTHATIDNDDNSCEVVNKRNIAVVSDVELAKRNESRIPEGTKWSTAWCVRTWIEWTEERRNSNATITSDLYKVVNSDVLALSNEEINYWLSKFVVEVRKKIPVGEPYPPNTLYQLCCGILRHLRENGRPELNVFENPSFKLFQDSLDAEMKRLTSVGVGSNVKQAEPFSDEQEEKLWALKLLGSHSPQVLLDTMVFLIGKHFALRSGKEHRNLQFNQLTLVPAKGNEPEKLVYSSFGEKNNLGGLKHRAHKGKRVEHYSNEENPERCLVAQYKNYLERCPKSALEKKMFYLTPRRNCSVGDKGIFNLCSRCDCDLFILSFERLCMHVSFLFDIRLVYCKSSRA